MLRAYDEKGGIGVYTRNIVSELLALDNDHEYVLFYRNAKYLGQFAHHANVEEHFVSGSNKVIWDQVAIPLACKRAKVDVLFHPKFTAPLLASCKVVMTVHGADWFIPEQAQFYKKLDVNYIRTFMPLYFKKCFRVISVSQRTTENFNRILDLPERKVKTIYFAPARHFQRIVEDSLLEKVRNKYRLPRHFILTLTKPDGDKRKNLGNLFKAYSRYHQMMAAPLPLVVGGKDCHHFRDIYSLSKDNSGDDIIFPGWLEQEDLAAIYSMATLFLYPSNLEAFPIPLTEAMACGTPIVTSNVNGLEEIAGKAAILVDPKNVEAIAQAIAEVAMDTDLQAILSAKGLERARLFDWNRCAADTLALLVEATE